MRTLTKIVGGLVLAGGIGLGILYAVGTGVSYVEKKQEERISQRKEIYETVINHFEDKQKDLKKGELEEILRNGVKTLHSSTEFKGDYVLADKGFAEAFVRLVGIYSDSIVEGKDHVSPENIDYLAASTEYLNNFVASHKKPLEEFGKSTAVSKEEAEELRKNPGKLLDWTLERSRAYLGFFDAAEKVLDSDLAYLRKADAFTSERTDDESLAFGKIIRIFIDKKESMKRRMTFYRALVEQSTKSLEAYSKERLP